MNDSEWGQISFWIEEVKAGQDDAVTRLWNEYFEKLCRLCRQKFQSYPQRVSDEDDLALMAFDSFCRRAKSGDYPDLRNRDELWNLLVTIAIRKGLNIQRANRAGKRGGGRVRGGSVFRTEDDWQRDQGFDAIASAEPTPEVVASMTETLEELLEKLPDESLRQVAILKMEGYSNREISEQIQRTERSVEFKLQRIRSLWVGDHSAGEVE